MQGTPDNRSNFQTLYFGELTAIVENQTSHSLLPQVHGLSTELFVVKLRVRGLPQLKVLAQGFSER